MARINNEKSSGCGFELLDHPADLGLRIWAPDLNALFATAAAALTSVLFDPQTLTAETSHKVEVAAQEIDLLMYNWLSEVLFLFDAEGLILSEFKIDEIKSENGGYRLHSSNRGENYRQDKQQVKTYVKAVTLHQLGIERVQNGYQATVYLDI